MIAISSVLQKNARKMATRWETSDTVISQASTMLHNSSAPIAQRLTRWLGINPQETTTDTLAHQDYTEHNTRLPHQIYIAQPHQPSYIGNGSFHPSRLDKHLRLTKCVQDNISSRLGQPTHKSQAYTGRE